MRPGRTTPAPGIPSWGSAHRADRPPPRVLAARALPDGAGGGESLHRSEADDGLDAVRLAREHLERRWSGSLVAEDPLWAAPEWELSRDGLPKVGCVVLAHPGTYAGFHAAMAAAEVGLAEGGEKDVDPLRDVLRLPAAARRTKVLPVAEGAQRRERARLPVVLITRRDSSGTEGLLLGEWSGRLLGDLDFHAFMTRPLYLGGPKEEELAFLHAYPELEGSLRLTPDGLMMGGWEQFDAACRWLSEGGSSLRFKFFIYRVRWAPGEEAELKPEAGVWMPVRCSRDLLLREPDSAFEEPLWAQITERAGGHVRAIAREHALLAE